MKEVDIIRFSGEGTIRTRNYIAEEHELILIRNKRVINTFLTYPLDQDELIAGFLYLSGLISSKNDIVDSNYSVNSNTYHVNLSRKKSIDNSTTTHRIVKKTVDPDLISAENILEMMKEFQSCSVLHEKTGAVHTAALANSSNLMFFFDDISRSNAIDKVIGKMIISEIEAADKVMFVSCRITEIIMSKLTRSGIPIIVSSSAPSHTAVKRGIDSGITIIGFCRNSRFSVYSCPERIKGLTIQYIH